MVNTLPLIRFPQGFFSELRNRLLKDKSRESFALLVGKRITNDGYTVIKVSNVYYPVPEDYESQSLTCLRLKREFVYDKLVKMQQLEDTDTLIDVHTHPFCNSGVSFSTVDDTDERNFHEWLTDTLDDTHYASIVLSQTDYSARLWERDQLQSNQHAARIKTQTVGESWPCSDMYELGEKDRESQEMQNGFLARSALALGLDTLRQIMTDQTIAIIGVGGLGSVIAENLIHSGFQAIHLFDPDRVEFSNLNRIVGAYYCDAEDNCYKVDTVKKHLLRINPKAHVFAHEIGIESQAAMPILMNCDWIFVATDNHFSRFKSQEIALELCVPLISAGVNITVDNEQIVDMSGEVIIARPGDGLCLNCLGRINPTIAAAEQNQGNYIGDELIRKGYVSGQEVKEPAVKTLNSIVGSLAVDILLNQFAERQKHIPVIVYENNERALFFEDTESTKNRPLDCFHCH